jgi:hypothetical protein
MVEILLSLALVGALGVAAFISVVTLLKDDPLTEFERVGDQMSDAPSVRAFERGRMDGAACATS